MCGPQLKPAVYTIKETPDGYAINLNGAPIKTPAGAAMVVPRPALAEAIVEELRSQAGSTAPLAQLAATAIDVVARNRGQTLNQILAYADSELLCHRAQNPSELAEEQQALWQPLLDWCAHRFDAPLESAPGVMTISQSPASMKALRRAIEGYDDFRLAALHQAVQTTGSLVLGLALAEKHKTAKQAFDAAALDETHQMKRWGEDPAALTRRAAVRRDLEVCAQCFAALSPSP